ncbi:MAG: DUF4838 domain-containing protein [Verrucomicrobia bacterium]|nr:DUF4838 domain-containing protein [Verrucomicrobiota bacterium]
MNSSIRHMIPALVAFICWFAAPVCIQTLGAEEKLLLSRDGKARAVIQTAANAPPVARFAAEELKKYLDKITGGEFPIQKKAASPDDTLRLVVGDCDESHAAGLDVSQLARDGFYLRSDKNTVFFVGRDGAEPLREILLPYRYCERGTLLAVYSFLEDVCGVRWLFPGERGEYAPHKPDLSIPPLALKEAPLIKMRTRYWANDGAKDLWEINGTEAYEPIYLFMIRQRYSSWRMATSHYFAYEESASRWLKTHPEYFRLGEEGKRVTKHHPILGWEMCMSNPGLAHEVALDAIAYFKGEPASSRNLPGVQFEQFGFERESFAINPADVSIGECRCAECKKYHDKDLGYSELAWLYYKRVADEVAAACPGKIISAWSYADYAKPPKSLTHAPDNVRIFLVTSGSSDWANKSYREATLKEMQAWREFAGRKLYLWVNQSSDNSKEVFGGVVNPLPSLMGPWLREVAPCLDGIFLGNESSHYLFQALNTYLFFHLAWNPQRDSKQVMNDYYAAAYGPAAEIIAGMDREFEEFWLKNVAKPRPLPGTDASAVRASNPTSAELWEDIYTDAALAPFQAKMEKAMAAAKGTGFADRVNIYAQHYLGAILAERQQYRRMVSLSDSQRLRAACATGSITLDGQMLEPDWTRAESGSMVVIQENVKPLVRTEVRVLYDKENLYAGWKCFEPQMGRLRAVAKTHDDDVLWQDDEVEIFLDPSGKRRGYCQLLANVAGVVADYRASHSQLDKNWTSHAKVAVFKGKDFWSLEMAVPFASLEATPPKTGDSWVANLCRGRALTEAKTGESQFLSWSQLVKGVFNRPICFGRIVFTEKGEAPAAAPNLIRNGSFEDSSFTPTDGYGGWGGQGMVFDGAESWSGEKSFKLSVSASDPAQTSAIAQRFSDKIRPNTEYVFTYCVKTSDITPLPEAGERDFVGIGAEVYLLTPEEGWRPCPQRFIVGTHEWRKYGMRIKTGKGTHPEACVCFVMKKCTGTAWIDDVRLEEAPPE